LEYEKKVMKVMKHLNLQNLLEVKT